MIELKKNYIDFGLKMSFRVGFIFEQRCDGRRDFLHLAFRVWRFIENLHGKQMKNVGIGVILMYLNKKR